MENKEYRYYVVYVSNSIFGSCQIIHYDRPIETMEDVKNVANWISKKWCNNNNVIIINWKELKGGINNE